MPFMEPRDLHYARQDGIHFVAYDGMSYECYYVHKQSLHTAETILTLYMIAHTFKSMTSSTLFMHAYTRPCMLAVMWQRLPLSQDII